MNEDERKAFHGMLDRFGLLCLVVFIASVAALAILPGIAGVCGVAIIWMIPLYLANRAHSQA